MAAMILAGTVPASAQALTVTASSTFDSEEVRRVRVQVAGSAAPESVVIGAIPGGVRVSIGVGTFDLSGECTQTNANQAECSGHLERVTGDLGGGDDSASLSADTSTSEARTSCASARATTFSAGVRSFDGVSRSFDGGPGDDRMDGIGSRSIPFVSLGGPATTGWKARRTTCWTRAMATTSSTSRSTTISVSRTGAWPAVPAATS